MSARKDTLLHKIRKQFESKYRHYPHILDQLDQELEELSYKSKISKDVDKPTILLFIILGFRRP